MKQAERITGDAAGLSGVAPRDRAQALLLSAI
jgi:hypothetical protein